jgi:hypothetical protein
MKCRRTTEKQWYVSPIAPCASVWQPSGAVAVFCPSLHSCGVIAKITTPLELKWRGMCGGTKDPAVKPKLLVAKLPDTPDETMIR